MFNYRDLGGHPVPGGRLRTGLLYRSDAVAGLDPDAAAGLGLHTAIDLRERGEKDAEPATVGPARVHELPVIDADPAAPYTQAGFTHWLVESRGHTWAAAVRLLAHEPLPAVFFCSSGKDRTGVLSGLLQSAVGMADAAVIADYAETERRMPPEYAELAMIRSRRAGLPEDIVMDGIGSPPELMAEVLAGVRDRHGTVARYLLDHGLAPDDLDLVRRRLVSAD
ncbi:MAG TPA: tyrosine-protein phosphatase [Sporichthya sp.]|nr:tyrosine-protein phosphatase [Sporichthya sp.]